MSSEEKKSIHRPFKRLRQRIARNPRAFRVYTVLRILVLEVLAMLIMMLSPHKFSLFPFMRIIENIGR